MPDDTRTVLDELDSKLTKSAASLDVYARAETRIDEHHRLLGKAEGLRLARSYIQDRIHTQADDCPHDSRSGDHTGRWRCDQCGTDTGPQEITAVSAPATGSSAPKTATPLVAQTKFANTYEAVTDGR